MRNIHIILLTVCLFSFIPEVEARIFESELDFSQRFGQPSGKVTKAEFGSRLCRYVKDDWLIQAWFLNGKCHQVKYSKVKFPRPNDEQITALLNSNSADCTWVKMKRNTPISELIVPSTAITYFVRSDDKALCVRNSMGATFKSLEWIQFEADATKERKAKETAIPQF